MGLHIFALLFVAVVFAQLGSASERHSHFFLTTASDILTLDPPSYFATTELDNVTLYRYDDQTQLMEVRVPWFKSALQSLGKQNEIEISFQIFVQPWLNLIINQSIDTEEYHVLQIREGCIWHHNGTVEVIFRYGYDRKPFMTLDVEAASWIADVPEAEYFANRSNANQSAINQTILFLESTCVQHITDLLVLGNDTFNRSVEPLLRMTKAPNANGSTTLDCRAYGHYPRNISMAWERNGQRVPETDVQMMTLPVGIRTKENYTFLSSLSVNVTSTEVDTYTCRVDHSTLQASVIQNLGSPDHSTAQRGSLSTGVVIALCLAVILLVTLIVFSAVAWLKTRPYKQTT